MRPLHKAFFSGIARVAVASFSALGVFFWLLAARLRAVEFRSVPLKTVCGFSI